MRKMNINKVYRRVVVKKVVSGVTCFSVGMIVGNIVRATLPPQANLAFRALGWIGGTMIAGAVAIPVCKYAENYVDELWDGFAACKEMIDNARFEKQQELRNEMNKFAKKQKVEA